MVAACDGFSFLHTHSGGPVTCRTVAFHTTWERCITIFEALRAHHPRLRPVARCSRPFIFVIQLQDCGKPYYLENYVAFFEALRAHYPHLRLVANCDLGDAAPVDLYDWHVYTGVKTEPPCPFGQGTALRSLLPCTLPAIAFNPSSQGLPSHPVLCCASRRSPSAVLCRLDASFRFDSVLTAQLLGSLRQQCAAAAQTRRPCLTCGRRLTSCGRAKTRTCSPQNTPSHPAAAAATSL